MIGNLTFQCISQETSAGTSSSGEKAGVLYRRMLDLFSKKDFKITPKGRES